MAERQRISAHIAAQMGVSIEDARDALRAFEDCTSHDGHTLH